MQVLVLKMNTPNTSHEPSNVATSKQQTALLNELPAAHNNGHENPVRSPLYLLNVRKPWSETYHTLIKAADTHNTLCMHTTNTTEAVKQDSVSALQLTIIYSILTPNTIKNYVFASSKPQNKDTKSCGGGWLCRACASSLDHWVATNNPPYTNTAEGWLTQHLHR